MGSDWISFQDVQFDCDAAEPGGQTIPHASCVRPSRLLPFFGSCEAFLLVLGHAPSGKSRARAGKMTAENIGFADPFAAKEAVGRFGVGPVLDMPTMRSHLFYLTTASKVVAIACHAELPQTRIPPLHCLSILPTGNPQTT